MIFKKRPTEPVGRSRTSQSTPKGAVFSYYANRSIRAGSAARNTREQQVDVSRPKRTHHWLRRLPTLGALLIIVFIALWCLQLSDNPKVITVGPSGSQVFLRNRKVYQEAAHNAFTQLLNSNKLTVNAGRITADLQKQFPELQVVSVSLPFIGSQPAVYIQPATPKLLLVGKSDGMYVVDSNGRALINGNQVPDLDALHIPVVNDQSGISVTLGRVALPSSTVTFITEVVGQLQAKGITLSGLTLPAGTTELQVRLNGVGYYIRYNLHGNAREEAGAYLAARQYLESNHKVVNEYIDVRVDNKVYYK
jgi:hypothetical protein